MSSVLLLQLLVGFAGAIVVAFVARRMKVLTTDGAIAAAIIGTIIYGFGGWSTAALLLLFFVSSGLLTRVQSHRKFHPEHRRGRSADQVLANGMVAALSAIWYAISQSPAAVSAFAGAVAASTADTWATEVGLLAAAPPRLITTLREVPPGTSGGVTWLGTVAGIVGAAAISFAAFYWLRTPVVPVLAGGVLAMVLDSVLGATIEGRVQIIDNNGVNFAATIAGAVLGVLLA